jgi:segregation and condensation protein A
VARFLGLLELYRDGAVSFDQAEALSELRVRWIGGARGAADPDEEYD